MNTITKNASFQDAVGKDSVAQVHETYWGYIIRCVSCVRSMAIILQGIAYVVGVSLLIAALGFWLIPGSAFSSDVAAFKMAMSSLSGVFGVALIWFASHGTQYEIQVDLARAEIREALRNRQGRVRVLNRIMFEEIGAVFIDRASAAEGKARLLMRLGNTTQVIEAARGAEETLTALRDRLGRDVLGKNAPTVTKSNRGFILEGAKGIVQAEPAEAVA